ncbi:MAG: TonB-dependent receptor [Candidatus Omnitrophota bacterium]
MKKDLLFFTVLAVFLQAGTVRAQEYDLGNIVVSAARSEIYQAETGSSTTVITGEEIENSGKLTVEEVLKSVPGVSVIGSGGFGGSVQVYMRGAKPGHVLVMIDGIEVNDPISIERSFDFANLTTDNIERIEVVRGPQSTLYGSDAMAGVINIVTKKGSLKPETAVFSETGAHNTFREGAEVRGTSGALDYSFYLSRLDSDGINKVSTGTEKDGYRNTTFSSRIGYKVLDDAELSLVSRYTDVKTDIDAAAYDDDPNYISWSKDYALKAAFDQPLNSWWKHNLSFSWHYLDRKDRSETDEAHPYDYISDWYKGDDQKTAWQHDFTLASWDTLIAGLEYEKERGSSYYYSEGVWGPYSSKQDSKSVENKGYYLQNQFKFRERLFITPGIRVDDHQLFGVETTYKISAVYHILESGTSLKANYGTAFKAPSLYQLYSSYGDPSLNPDESKSYDFGFEQKLFSDKLSFSLTRFHNDFRDMVDYDSAASKYMNIGRARTEGYEAGAGFRFFDGLSINANFTYTDTENKETGLELLRRPRRQVNLDLDWRFMPKADLNLGMSYVGRRRDVIYDAYYNESFVTDKAYTVFRIASSYELTRNFRVFARIENIFDKKYEEIPGYAVPGRSFYAGLRASF